MTKDDNILLALAYALIHLGISPVYHMREVGKNQHAPMWAKAIEDKFEDGKPWGREEFDRAMGEYEVNTHPMSVQPTMVANGRRDELSEAEKPDKASFGSLPSPFKIDFPAFKTDVLAKTDWTVLEDSYTNANTDVARGRV